MTGGQHTPPPRKSKPQLLSSYHHIPNVIMRFSLFPACATWFACVVAQSHGEGAEGTEMGPVAFLWPADRNWSAAADNIAPCGSTDGPANRTQFPLSQGAVALTIADEAWNVAIRLATGNGKPTYFYRCARTKGLTTPHQIHGPRKISSTTRLCPTFRRLTPATNATSCRISTVYLPVRTPPSRWSTGESSRGRTTGRTNRSLLVPTSYVPCTALESPLGC